MELAHIRVDQMDAFIFVSIWGVIIYMASKFMARIHNVNKTWNNTNKNDQFGRCYVSFL